MECKVALNFLSGYLQRHETSHKILIRDLRVGPDGVKKMKILRTLLLVIPLLILPQHVALAQETDVEGSSDHPLLPRIEHFYISGYEQYGYESHEFYDAQDNEYVIEGRKWVIEYTLKNGFEAPGQLKVRKNHIDAIKKIGGTILFDRGLYMKVASGNKDTWIDVWVSDHGTDYTLTIVEESAPGPEVVADPGILARDTKQTVARSPVGQSTREEEEEKKDPNIERIEQALAATKRNRDQAISNLRKVSQKVSSGLAMACPGVAETPPPPAVPIPYPNIGMAGETAKGSRKVKIASDKAVALRNKSSFQKTESDEVGRKTQALTELIQRHYEQGTIGEKDRFSWKNKLMSYQDQAATIARTLELYVEEIEKLLAESRKELGIR